MPLGSIDTLPFAGICDDEFMFIQSDYECCEQVFDQIDQLYFFRFNALVIEPMIKKIQRITL